MRFTDLLLGAAAVTSVLAAPATDITTTSTSLSKQRRKSKFQFTGVNESGAEFGNKNLPGLLGKDYTWPVKSTIDVSESARFIQKNCDSLANSLDTHWQRIQYLPDSYHDGTCYPHADDRHDQCHLLSRTDGCEFFCVDPHI